MYEKTETASAYARHRQIHQGVLQSLLEGSRLNAASRVLEVGCGTGNYICAIQKQTNCECSGLDPSAAMLDKARAQSEDVTFLQGKAEALPFPSPDFDFVFSMNVIHHVEEVSSYFEEAFRIMNAGGRFCTVTQSEAMIRNRRPLANYFPESVDADLRRYPRIEDLRKTMEGTGFTGIEEQTIEQSSELSDIRPYKNKAFSCLHLMPEKSYQEGLEKMERDLKKGPIERMYRYLLLWGRKSS